MKNLWIGLAALATFTLGLSAQTLGTVRVHFDQQVAVGANTLQAGDYTVTEVGTNANSPILRFQSSDGHSVVVFASRESQLDDASHTSVILTADTDGKERVSRIEIEGSNLQFVLR